MWYDFVIIIVTFVDENNPPGIVASSLIKEDRHTCFYPNVRTEVMKENLLRKMAAPGDTWQQYKIKILKRYETHGEETSNLDSDEEVKNRNRKRKTNVCLSEDSEDSSDEQNHQQPTKKRLDFSRSPSPLKPKAAESANTNKMDANSIARCTPSPTVMFSSPIASSSHAHPSVDSPAVPSQPKMCPSDCATSKQLAIQQSHLIQIVTDLSKQVSEINRKVDLILGRPEEPRTPRRQDPFSMPQFLTNLPVNDDESFCHLNEQIKNSDNKQAMIQFLAAIGGKNLRSFATNMLRRILLDEVAEQYSLTGKKMKNSNKKSFLDTETCKLIFQVCKKVHGTVTDDKLKEIISDWLNQAKIRLSRRAERQNKIDHDASLV